MDDPSTHNIIKSYWEITKLSFIIMILILVGSEWKFVKSQIKNALTNINSIHVGIVKVGIKLPNFKSNLKEGKPTHIFGNWPSHQRTISPTVKFIDGFFDDKGFKMEFIDIQAKDNLDLNGGYIGDSNELMYLGHNEEALELKPGDRLRIFTFNPNKVETDKNLKKLAGAGTIKTITNSVTAVCILKDKYKTKIKFKKDSKKIFVDDEGQLKGLNKIKKKTHCIDKGQPRQEGLFKASEGEGDRIILISSNNQILMDFDYFITPQNMP